ncbi:MAG: ribonuclease III [Clostridiales bacterium]|jgi:ribonuclease-3|nr:ribonuclease III [Clostridiales bacterium]
MEKQKIAEIEKIIGYTFKDKAGLELALTHSSFDGERNYERLEFFGDSILDFAVAEYLMKNFDLDEGKMTEKRKNLVNKKLLAQVVTENSIDKFLKTSANIVKSDKMKSSVFESLTAAIYYDAGMSEAYAFILRFLGRYFADEETDYKSRLNEIVIKKFGEYPVYESYEEKEKNGRFFSRVTVKGKSRGEGYGESKRQAEQAAAKAAFERFDKN